MFGFLNVCKPKGVTSSRVVDTIRRITKIRQVGHSGTLDPVAQGVLPVAIGKATKLIDYLSNEKEYVAQMQFGKSSPTYDTESDVSDILNANDVTVEELVNILPAFVGEIEQTPPIYSAVHYNGKRLYELARQNVKPEDIEIPKRTILIEKLELINFDFGQQTAEIKIKCSKGTYIRSLIHDIGLKLNSSAIMSKLIRVNSSGFRIENSLKLDELTLDIIKDNLLNCEKVLNMKSVEISDDEFKKVKNGNDIFCNNDILIENEKVLVNFDGATVALGERSGKNIVINKVFV